MNCDHTNHIREVLRQSVEAVFGELDDSDTEMLKGIESEISMLEFDNNLSVSQ